MKKVKFNQTLKDGYMILFLPDKEYLVINTDDKYIYVNSEINEVVMFKKEDEHKYFQYVQNEKFE